MSSLATGASFTGVTLNVIVFAVASVSAPPKAVPPSSWTWKVKLASLLPLALAVGVNTSLPALISSMLMKLPAAKLLPFSVSTPPDGSVVILTEMNESAGTSLASVKPNSLAVKTCAVSSHVVMVLLAPDGAWFGVATVTWMVPAALSPS